ncbi:MAG TPA: hypothetical protein VFD94_05710 [Jatrophihabitans sp.]|nr:hypothetical protein [Jatrophihabitans sp.]
MSSDDPATQDELAGVQAALDRLTSPAPDTDQPLVELAGRLDDLHQELQAALTGLDRS